MVKYFVEPSTARNATSRFPSLPICQFASFPCRLCHGGRGVVSGEGHQPSSTMTHKAAGGATSRSSQQEPLYRLSLYADRRVAHWLWRPGHRDGAGPLPPAGGGPADHLMQLQRLAGSGSTALVWVTQGFGRACTSIEASWVRDSHDVVDVVVFRGD